MVVEWRFVPFRSRFGSGHKNARTTNFELTAHQTMAFHSLLTWLVLYLSVSWLLPPHRSLTEPIAQESHYHTDSVALSVRLHFDCFSSNLCH